MINFIKPKEIKPKQTFSVLIYGPTGIGKTTAAISAPAPVALVDFDGGVNRVDARFLGSGTDEEVLTAQIEQWDGYLKMVEAMRNVPVNSIVIDTVGKMIDMITTYVLTSADYPYHKKDLKKPTLQAYGDIKTEFVGFVRGIKNIGKNIIFVAQEVESIQKNRKGEDIRYHQPSAGSDKNRTEILQDLDLVGYMFKDENRTCITFDQTDSYYGKNTCKAPSTVEVKMLAEDEKNILLTWIHGLYVKVQEQNQQRSEYVSQVNDMLAKVGAISNAEQANEFVKFAKSVKWIADAKVKVLNEFNEKAKALNLKNVKGVYEQAV